MTHPSDPDYDPDRHNYVKRTAAKRAADDLKYGLPAMDKVKAALSLKNEQTDEDTPSA